MKKSNLITILIIVAVLVIAYFVLSKSPVPTDEELVKCIGENSMLYVKLGCHACEVQEEMFGENLEHLNIIDCFYDMESCVEAEIEATPTWIIDGEKHVGVKSIEKLKELTGC